MTTDTHASPPGPSSFTAFRELRRLGFLDYAGQLWQTHGDTFQLRLGPRTLIFAFHPDAVRHVSVGNRQNYDKLHSYNVVRRYLIGDGLLASTGALWRRQRKLMAPFYTPRGVEAYAGLMLREGRHALERWQRLAQSGHMVEMGEEMTTVTASIILQAMFSAETDETIVEMKETVETMLRFTATRQQSIPFPLWIPTSTNRAYLAARHHVYTYIQALLDQRRALPESEWPDDLLSRLMQARDEASGQSMSDSLLRDESITTFFAGHETTARTMSAAWYALASAPAVAERLHAELDTVLGERTPTLEELHRLPYTLQVIKEVLRLYPPAPFYVRDAVDDDEVGGYHIAAGSSVMLSPYYTHRHPEFWDNPLQFDPDRWTPEREAVRHPFAYHPFAAGQRICIGNNFSLLESHILLALLAKRFAPQLQPGHTPRWAMEGTLSIKNGLPMRIQARHSEN